MGRESYGLAWYKKTQTTCWNWLGLSKFSVNSCPRFDRYHVRFPRAISLISKNEKWKISYDSKLSFESKWAVIFENSMRPKRFYHLVFDHHTVWSIKCRRSFGQSTLTHGRPLWPTTSRFYSQLRSHYMVSWTRVLGWKAFSKWYSALKTWNNLRGQPRKSQSLTRSAHLH